MGKMLWQLVREHQLPSFPLKEPLPEWVQDWMRDKEVRVRELSVLEEMLRNPNDVADGGPFVM